MSQVFNEQASLISEIENFTAKLDDRCVSQILNQEFFYHASNELPNHIPTEQASSQLLAKKLLQQLTPKPECDQIIDQLEHRLKVIRDGKCDQLQEIKSKFEKEKDKMRSCGAKVKDFVEIYDEELKGVTIPNTLTKKAISYFESSSREWALDEMLSDLIESLEPEEYSDDSGSLEGEAFDEQTKISLDNLIDQLKLMDSSFNFSS